MKKTILVTGSTDGIGKLTAIKFAEDGHNVYLHGRTRRNFLIT
jgi:short-subunit dehydrogenase